MSTPDFPSFLALKMRAWGWQAADLARESGVSASHISRLLMAKRRPSADQLVKLARAFHEIPDNWLIVGGHPELSPAWRSSQPEDPFTLIGEGLKAGGWSDDVRQAILLLLGELPRLARP